MPRRKRFSERQVLETLLHQGIIIRCARCQMPFIGGRSLIDKANSHWVGYAEREHLHEIALGGPDEPANCRYSAKECHALATNGTKATSAGSSKHRIAKVRRISGQNKPKRKTPIASHGFDKTRTRHMSGKVTRRSR